MGQKPNFLPFFCRKSRNCTLTKYTRIPLICLVTLPKNYTKLKKRHHSTILCIKKQGVHGPFIFTSLGGSLRKLCSQLARVRVKPSVCAYFCWLLGRHADGNVLKLNFQHVGFFSAYQARISVHASHFDSRCQKISTRRCRTR